jgi:hypothetical protein
LALLGVYWRQELLYDSVLPILDGSVSLLSLLFVVLVIDEETSVVVEVAKFNIVKLFGE